MKQGIFLNQRILEGLGNFPAAGICLLSLSTTGQILLDHALHGREVFCSRQPDYVSGRYDVLYYIHDALCALYNYCISAIYTFPSSRLDRRLVFPLERHGADLDGTVVVPEVFPWICFGRFFTVLATAMNMPEHRNDAGAVLAKESATCRRSRPPRDQRQFA